MTDVHLFNKLSELPEGLKTEVVDFIDFLNYKRKKKN